MSKGTKQDTTTPITLTPAEKREALFRARIAKRQLAQWREADVAPDAFPATAPLYDEGYIMQAIATLQGMLARSRATRAGAEAEARGLCSGSVVDLAAWRGARA